MKVLVAGLGMAMVVVSAVGLGRVGATEDAANPAFYTERVKPILDKSCARCHGEGSRYRGGLDIRTRESMLKGGTSGPALVPGDPAKSLLVRLIRHEGPAEDPMPMPPNKEKLADADIAVVEQWVKAGAVMPVEAAKP